MLFVYGTPDFEKKLKTNDFKNLQSCVSGLRRKIEKKQAYTGFDRFQSSGFYVKKKLKYKYRLIASSYVCKMDDEEHELLVFHDIMIRKDPNYNDSGNPECFCKNPDVYAKKHGYKWKDYDKDCNNYCRMRLQEGARLVSKAKPSNYENEILYNTLQNDNRQGRDYSVYEMTEWVASLKDDKNTDLLGTFLHKLYECVVYAVESAAANEKEDGEWGIQLVEYGAGQRKYFSYYFNTSELVFALGRIDGLEYDAKAFVAQNRGVFNPFDKQLFLKRMVRSYPETIVTNPDNPEPWQNIEQEKSNNMALSPEELEILSSVLNPETRRYPLFINGRAGSGKSTILQFLFTAYYFQYLRSEDEHAASPVYFTYSDKLLTAARETVNRLLCNHEHLGGMPKEEKERAKHKQDFSRDKSFRNFSAFLLEVARTNKNIKFLPGQKIDFQRFRKLWTARFHSDREIKNKTTPEICWHVIRTFIKGNSVGSLMDIDEYRENPSHSISEAMFELIYKKVWPWYSDLTLFTDKGEGEFEIKHKFQYWDDQDLVRYVLMDDEENEAGSLLDRYFEQHPRFCAIFCDESQDFTHMELEAILEMSLFLYRNVDENHVHCIPFVFAGDPFQTLNPTGFSWEATKSGFVEKIARVLDKKAEKIDLNYKELKMNYRSEADIVKFSNAVQIIRASKLNPEKHVVEPQLPWNEAKGACMFFDWGNANFWEWLGKNEDVSFIIPCESGDKAEYVEGHKRLKDNICPVGEPVNEESFKYPVFGAQDIKGLEYDKVVVYGFGEHDVKEKRGTFKALLEADGSKADDNSLELEYFINRLYVAVTRSKKQLFVLDESESTFWDRLKSFADEQDDYSRKIEWLKSLVPGNCKKAWEIGGSVEEKFALPAIAGRTALNGEASGESRERFAEQLLNEGIDNRDESRLNIALKRYAAIYGANSDKCHEISGCIAYLKDDAEKAAVEFVAAGRSLAASHCRFLEFFADESKRDAAFSEMQKLGGKDEDCKNSLELKLVRVCLGKDPQTDGFFVGCMHKCLDNYSDYAHESGHEIFAWEKDAESWGKCFELLLNGINPVRLSDAEKCEIAKTVEDADLVQIGLPKVVDFYVKTRMYDKLAAIDISEVEDPATLKKIKMYSAPFPKNLKAFGDAKDYATICDIYAEQYGMQGDGIAEHLDEASIRTIFEASKKERKRIDSGKLVCLFGKCFDPDVWDVYRNSQKLEKSYRAECIQILCGLKTKTTKDIKVAESVLRQTAAFNSAENLNRLYLCCLGIANEHPDSIDFKACSDALKRTFGMEMQENASRYGLTFVDMMQFGRACEYLAMHAKKEDAQGLWENVISFYELLEKTELAHGKERDLRIRIINAKEKIIKVCDDLLNTQKRGKFVNSDKLHQYIKVKTQCDEEIADDKKEKGINDAEIALAIGKKDEFYSNTMRIASFVWNRGGYLIKHDGEQDAKQKLESRAADEIAQEPKDDSLSTTGNEADDLNDAIVADVHVAPEKESEAMDEAMEVAFEPSADATNGEGVSESEVVPEVESPLPEIQNIVPGGGSAALKLTFFAAKGRLNIEDQESGSQWNITAKGVSVDGETRGHVSGMKIEGTSFSVSTSEKQIVLSDDRCGYEFTIKLP